MPDSKGNTPSIGWTFKKGIFSPPPLTEDELEKNNEKAIAANSAMKQLLMEEASKEISIFQDAVDLDMAKDEEALALPKWKKYRVLLSRVDANVAEPVSWPEKP
ncbi:tail fiber assembly protein [Pantoea sp. PNT02]|nr:tail fiber assembly protein [Pantoea sp. PNT02]